MSQSIALPLVTVEVRRNLENVITRDVFAHEVPILRLMHGTEQFKVVDDDAGEKAIPADAHAEFARLKRAYDNANASYVQKVYGDAEALGAKLGLRVQPAEEGALPVMAEVNIGHKVRRADKPAEKAKASK